jgi:hypothetical protein
MAMDVTSNSLNEENYLNGYPKIVFIDKIALAIFSEHKLYNIV